MPTRNRTADPEVAERLAAIRGERRYSLQKVSNLIAQAYPEDMWIVPSTIHRLEKGEMTPSHTDLAMLADVYDVTVSDLAPKMVDEAYELLARMTEALGDVTKAKRRRASRRGAAGQAGSRCGAEESLLIGAALIGAA